MRDWDTAYEIRRDMELDRRLDAGLPTRATTPHNATKHDERTRVHKQETIQPATTPGPENNEQGTP